ncbi:gp53-like domain-containing protein [Salmonella enterica]|uniref:gp53-like domain-containing protein n=3 Tax=Salmonella enterica TaxID=28901 RepID=UPI00092D14DB
MIIGFGNNVVSSLAADITASQTTIQVMPGAGAMFANLLTSDYANSSNPLKTYAKITLTDAKETVFEVCHLTAVNNDMLTVIRGQEGTTAKGWSLNDVIANFATRGSENQFVQIEELQSGHYVAGVAGGTENNLTLELPATYFVNGGVDWTLRTPLVVIPALNNTGASTLQLTMGGRVLGIFPLYKGNKAELSANDIIKDIPILCVLDNTKTYFSVLNPLEIYLGSRYLQKDQNLSDVPDKAKGRSSLEVYSKTESDKNYMAKSQCGADIPDKPLFVQNIGLKETLNPTKRVSIGNIGTGVFDGSTPCINIGDSDSGFIGSADGVLDIYCNGAKVGYIDGNGLHMLTDIHFDNARMTTNGDIFSSVWGNNWLSIWITNQLNTRGTIDWINSELAVRDNNINTRATWDYVNQTFARKNTGSIQDWGWILDDSTGFIMQWGTLGNSNGTYNFPRAFPVGCFAVFVTNTNAQGTQVDNAFGYPVSNSQFFAATKSSGIANLVNNFPVAWLALGR